MRELSKSLKPATFLPNFALLPKRDLSHRQAGYFLGTPNSRRQLGKN